MFRINLLMIVALLAFGSCQKPAKQTINKKIEGVWEKHWSGMPIPLTMNMTSFQTQHAFYIGLGYEDAFRQEFRKFTTQGGWSLIQDFPGKAREGAVAFVLGKKAYVGLGSDNQKNEFLTDFWVYETEGDTWDSLRMPFPGEGREGAVAFVRDGKAYVGCGIGEREGQGQVFLGDFYEFVPETGWRQIKDLTLNSRAFATTMETEGDIYLCLGVKDGQACRDMWRLKKEILAWEQMTPLKWEEFPEVSGRVSSFVMKVKNEQELAFVYSNPQECYVYSPQTNMWEIIYDFPGISRCFILDGILYGISGLNTYQYISK